MNTSDEVNEVVEVEAPAVEAPVVEESVEEVAPPQPKKTTRRKKTTTSKKAPVSAPAPVVEPSVEAPTKKKAKVAEEQAPRVSNRRRN